jgi:hypothetical protein
VMLFVHLRLLVDKAHLGGWGPPKRALPMFLRD